MGLERESGESTMSHNLELPDVLYAALQKAAEASGITPEGWIAAHLPHENNQTFSSKPKTLADLFAGRVGRMRSGGKETLSENCGEKYAAHLEQKRREGHL
jgi:hypothetical protein